MAWLVCDVSSESGSERMELGYDYINFLIPDTSPEKKEIRLEYRVGRLSIDNTSRGQNQLRPTRKIYNFLSAIVCP